LLSGFESRAERIKGAVGDSLGDFRNNLIASQEKLVYIFFQHVYTWRIIGMNITNSGDHPEKKEHQ
jgi:hypothetical protein